MKNRTTIYTDARNRRIRAETVLWNTRTDAANQAMQQLEYLVIGFGNQAYLQGLGERIGRAVAPVEDFAKIDNGNLPGKISYSCWTFKTDTSPADIQARCNLFEMYQEETLDPRDPERTLGAYLESLIAL